MFRFNLGCSWVPAAARDALRQGKAGNRMRVRGHLDLANSSWLVYLPRELEAESIDVSGCMNLRGLPERLKCKVLVMRRTNIVCLREGLQVSSRIDAAGCRNLQRVAALKTSEVRLSGCSLLEQLAEGLLVRELDLAGCELLQAIPNSVATSVRNLNVSGCRRLSVLPEMFSQLETLDVRSCVNLKTLPPDIRIRSWIDVADSGLEGLPDSLRSVRTCWRGMPVSNRVAFEPSTITVEEILAEKNIEVRRVLLERVGVDWFVSNAKAQVADSDRDPGGNRRLLRISFHNGPDVVCLEVQCPSTGRKYLLQVPPRTQTCAQGAAWIAGYNHAGQYRPVLET